MCPHSPSPQCAAGREPGSVMVIIGMYMYIVLYYVQCTCTYTCNCAYTCSVLVKNQFSYVIGEGERANLVV